MLAHFLGLTLIVAVHAAGPLAEAAAAVPGVAAAEDAPAGADTSGAVADTSGAGAPAEADTAGHGLPQAAAAAPADTSERITGTSFRFGWTPEQASRLGDFPIARTPGQRGEVARAGDAAWFGVPGKVTLFFRGGRLARARFAFEEPSPNAVDYVRDQLTRAGFKRTCATLEPAKTDCTWLGRTRVRLEGAGKALTATIERAPKPAPPRKPPPPPPPPPPPFATASEPFVLGRAGVRNALPDPEFAAPPDPRSYYPPAARSAGVQGNVWVRARVDTTGELMDVTIIRSIRELDAAALETVKRVRFRPYRIADRPARFEVEFPVRFTLH